MERADQKAGRNGVTVDREVEGPAEGEAWACLLMHSKHANTRNTLHKHPALFGDMDVEDILVLVVVRVAQAGVPVHTTAGAVWVGTVACILSRKDMEAVHWHSGVLELIPRGPFPVHVKAACPAWLGVGHAWEAVLVLREAFPPLSFWLWLSSLPGPLPHHPSSPPPLAGVPRRGSLTHRILWNSALPV